MNQIRLNSMKAYIEKKNAVTIKELQALFPEVSLMTIHRVLDVLVEEGAVVKFRGGAKSVVHNGDPGRAGRALSHDPGQQVAGVARLDLPVQITFIHQFQVQLFDGFPYSHGP